MSYDVVKQAEAFREAALQEGFILTGIGGLPEDRWFCLDLNQVGSVFVRIEAESLLRLVQLARSFARDEGSGQHNAILQLGFFPESMESQKVVPCHRLYHLLSRRDCERAFRLRYWLEEQGHPYVPAGE